MEGEVAMNDGLDMNGNVSAAEAVIDITADVPVIIPEELNTSIKEYDPIAASILALRGKYEGKAYDVTTTTGMKSAVEARMELRTLRVQVESKRKDLKSDVLERGRRIDGAAKKLSEAISALEDPIDELIKTEQQRKEL